MKIFNHGLGATKYISAAILLLPALLASIFLQYFPPPTIDIFVYGGIDVFLYNLCILILIPYFVLFILGLGELYLSRLPNEDLHPLESAGLRLISFFAGCGVLTVLGFLLGLLNLLYFWVCFPIFIVVIYYYFFQPASGQAAVDLWDWISAKNDSGVFRFGSIILRAVLVAIIASIILSRGILLELFKDGGLHQYFSYFVDTRLYHSIWMNPSHPILYDYLAGRGQGVLLFFTGFTNQFTIQIMGAIYLIMIGVIVRQVLRLLSSGFGKADDTPSLRSYLPDLAMLLVLTSPMLDMETARFHLQTGAFFLFLCWAAPLFLMLGAKKSHWLFLSLIPVIVAFPITSGVFYAFIGWILGIVIIALLITRHTALLKFPLLLLVFGGVSAIFSFSLNWLYVGIPELQPSSIFVPLIWIERFQHWSSRGLIAYLDFSLGQSVSPSSISIQKIGVEALRLFSYPSGALAKLLNAPQHLGSYYPALVIAIFVWIAIGQLRNRNAQAETRKPVNTLFIYGLTFPSFYILKFLLTTFIQQGSVHRMLLFMDVFPIVMFISMLYFLIHKVERRLQKTGLRISESATAALLRSKYYSALMASIVWGCCFSLSLINLWPYFGRRSFPAQLLLLALVAALGAGLSFYPLKSIPRFYEDTTRKQKLSLMAISLLLAVLLSSLAGLSPYLAVPHTLQISALNDKNPASSSSEVRLLELKINGKKIGLTSLERRGDWLEEGKELRSYGQGTLKYVFTAKWNSSVEVLFDQGPSAGLVKIEYDHQGPVLKDLYGVQTSESVFFPEPSLFTNTTSLILVALFFAVEFVVIFGFLSFVLAYYPAQTVNVSAALLLGLTLTMVQFQANIGLVKIKGAWQYLIGNQGAVPAYGPVITYGADTGDRSDVFHCLAILKKVPGPAQVLNLNGFAAVEPCLFSPLLPRDKIVHHYEAVAITESYYQTLMFGQPQEAYKIYKDLGINYFYIRKADLLFVNLGYSRALEPENLEQYFDVYAEAFDFYILTWRGEGLYPVSPQLGREISLWYDNSKDKKINTLNFWWVGREGLGDWVQTQP